MSVWRQKAIQCLPENKVEFENPNTTIYTVFSELLHAVIEAHKNNNADRLQLIYGFAEWCFRQNAKELWNAAGVSFYEHLYNYKETRESFTKWVKKDVYRDVSVLLEISVNKAELEKLEKFYK